MDSLGGGAKNFNHPIAYLFAPGNAFTSVQKCRKRLTVRLRVTQSQSIHTDIKLLYMFTRPDRTKIRLCIGN